MRTAQTLGASPNRRGVVLIFSVAVLAVLAVLAAAFTGVSRVERNVSRNYIDHVRSIMLATAGVELAVANLSRDVRDPATMHRHKFFGEDLDENDLPEPGEDADNDGWQEASCPLARTLHPSYMMDVDRDGKLDAADLIEVDGRHLGASGMLPSTYTPRGDFFSVKVTDASQKINVNMDGHPFLKTILENLCEEAGLDPGVGDSVYRNRPYTSMLEVRDRCRLDARTFETLKDLLTVRSWSDKKVVNAVPLWQRIRPGLAAGSYIYTWEEIRPRTIDFPKNARGEVVGRCPVNINMAPREVLVALLRGLTGFYVDEQETRTVGVDDGYQLMDVVYTYSGSSGALGKIRSTPPLNKDQAETIADGILAHRRANLFHGWQDFNKFLWDDCWGKGILTRQQCDVLKANFNPNSSLNAFNPEYEELAWVDKTELKYWTTELCFGPTGYFEIESLGRVVDGQRQVVAESEALVEVKMFDIYRETTQKDFLYDFWHNGAPLSSLISRNRGAGKTRGQLALATYPELPVKEWVKDADYDGHITLATKVTDGAGAAFRATYNDRGLDADTGQARVPDTNGPYRDRLVEQRGGSGAWKPGKLFPDGVYAELDSVPMYNFCPSNPHDFYGCFWIKPHFFPEHAGRTRVFMTWQKPTGRDFIPLMPLGIYCTVTSFVEEHSVGGYEYQEPWDTPAILGGGTVGGWEGACATPCLNHLEHGHAAIERGGEMWGTMFEAGKWLHVGWIHDGKRFENRPGVIGDHHENLDTLYVNGRKVSGIFAYEQGDCFHPCDHSGQLLRLGARRNEIRLNTVPDATIDQVLVWNEVHAPQAEQRILDEYDEGRFYGEDDGTFTSRAIDFPQEMGLPPGTPVSIACVAWTQYVPDSLPNGKLTIEVVKAGDRRPLAGSHEYSKPGGEKVDVLATEPVRYVVHFRPGASGTAPIVDTLVFDDITLMATAGPRFLSWAWATK